MSKDSTYINIDIHLILQRLNGLKDDQILLGNKLN